MEELNFLPDDQLNAFFRRKKTKMSCIENPNMFLNQIRDNGLIPEDLYQEVIKMRMKKTKQSGVYKILEGVEKMGGQSVKLFWSCVFKDHIQKSYPIFDTLQKELLDISFREKRPSAGQPSRNNEAERPGTMQIQEKVVTKREREKIDQEIDEAKPGTSFWSRQMNPAKKSTSLLLYERETLPVTCNQKKGVLYPDKLATVVQSSEMDLLDFLSYNVLVDFLREKKTMMSCIPNPSIFLNQLRDNKLVPEYLYQEVMKMRNEKTKQSGVYKILEGVEKMGGQSVKSFWSCVFQDHIQMCYPIFFTLQKELLDSSFLEKQPSAEQPRRDKESGRPGTMQIQEKVVTKREESDQEKDEAKPGTSSGSSQKKPARKSSLLHERETLPVTCNQKKGVLYPAKLATEDECILSETQWFSPPEFEAFSGMERSKNWKTNICYRNIPLQTFIKDGRLKCKARYRGRAREKQPVPSSSGGATSLMCTKPTFIFNFNT